MTTIKEILKDELLKIRQAQSECIDDNGNVFNYDKYRYNELIKMEQECLQGLSYAEKIERS